MRNKKIAWLLTFLLFSGAAILWTWTLTPQPRLAAFLEHPWMVLGSYLVQPAFIVECLHIGLKIFNWSAVMVLIANVCFWLYVFYRQLTAREDLWIRISIENWLLGVAVNFGNFGVAVLYSAYILASSGLAE